MKKKKAKRLLKWLAIAAVSPVVLFLLLAIVIYIPAVQNFIVGKVTERLSATTGIALRVDNVRLAFPLDLSVRGVEAVERGDTLLAVRALRLNVRMLPLLEGRADIDGFELYNTRLNTKALIADTYVRGSIRELTARSHGVEWNAGRMRLDRARLDGADLYVALSDTTTEKDTTAAAPWNIAVDRLDITRSAVRLSLPGDSMRLALAMGEAHLEDGRFDTGAGNYTLRRLALREGGVTYATRRGDGAGPRRLPNEAFHTTDDLLWPGMKVPAGLSADYIHLADLHLQLDSLSYSADGRIGARLHRLAFREHSGLEVKDLSARVSMDARHLSVSGIGLQTAASQLDAAAELDFAALESGRGGNMRLRLDGTVGDADIRTLMRGLADEALLRAWPRKALRVKLAASGNMDAVALDALTLEIPGAATLDARGRFYPSRPETEGAVSFLLKAPDLSFAQAMLGGAQAGFALPRHLTAKGKATLRGDRYTAEAQVGLPGGRLTASAALNTARETYELKARAQGFPVGGFLPGSGLGRFSGRLEAHGAGFDPFARHARLKAAATVDAFTAAGYDLGGLKFTAALGGSVLKADFEANNPLAEGTGHLETTLGDILQGRLTAELPLINVQQLAGLKDTLHLGTSVDIGFNARRDLSAYSAEGGLRNVRFLTPERSVPSKNLDFAFATGRDTTTALISSGDLYLNLGTKGNLEHFTAALDKCLAEMERQTKEKIIDREKMRSALPVVALRLDAGHNNPLSKILYLKGISYDALHVRLESDPQDGIDGRLGIGALKNGTLLVDTVDLNIYQDTTGLKLGGYARNYRKQNPHKFEAQLDAFLHRTGAGAKVTLLDEKGRKSMDLGLQAALAEGGIRLSLYPEHPVIAYRNFSVNSNNFIFLGRDKSIRADMRLLADDGTGMDIYTTEADSATNDITLSLTDINLEELSNVLAFLPQMKGMLSGDIHVVGNENTLSASTLFTTRNFELEGAALGDLGIEAFYLPDTEGKHHADVYISAQEREVMKFEGYYRDSLDGYIEGKATLQDFPLEMLGGFLAGTDFGMRGTTKGEISIAGNLDAPRIDGALDFDTAHFFSEVYGVDFLLDEQPVPIDNGRIRFKDYGLYSRQNGNPLVINGSVDLMNLDLDLTMQARNYELVNTKQKKSSTVFGKVYANYAGTLRGNINALTLRGKLDVLERTDMTYILKDSPLTVDDRLSNLVQFVSFADTTTVEEAVPEPASSLDITLGISVSDAAQFRCNLSEDGQNYVELEGGGDLTLRLTQQGDMRLTGRFTANSGEMKYSLPVIPLKTFSIVQGSYVDFTGDVLNPTLNITAKERVKATVTENDAPRSVAFDVGVAITKPLNDMGLEFIIEAPEDLSMQNQLAAMTPAQRGKTAVTMLATGMYMTDDLLTAGGSGFKASNALNAFLQSEIQSIAGSALKTIDVTVGMESGTSSTGTETTDYSFQFAKRFWNNRISVIIGGKVSTGEEARNSAESFIDNIAVEYRLDKSSTRYVKVFYDRGTQDPLEGQLTKTGAGLILRRKTDRLGELFIFRNRKDK